MRIVFVILIYFLLSCTPEKDQTISGTVSYATDGYIGRSLKHYQLTQTNIRDSLYVLSYSWEVVNPSDTSKQYRQQCSFNLVPGHLQARQTVKFNDTTAFPLWQLDSRTYRIKERDYTVYKYVFNVHADDFCVRAATRIWSPEFGIVVWELATGQMHTSYANQ